MLSGTHVRRLSFMALCGAVLACTDGFTPRDGHYYGPEVSFKVSHGELSDIRLFGLECRVPHPDNEALALCLERVPGWLAGSVALREATFSARLEAVELTGNFSTNGRDVRGTWSFESVCQGNATLSCAASGEWEAVWTSELTPVVNDSGADADAATTPDGPSSGPDIGPDLPPDSGPLGPPVPVGASDGQQAAQAIVDQHRQSAGVGPVAMDEALNRAAQNHADYFALHADKYASSGLNPHSENSEWSEGFTGEGLGERFNHAGVVMAGGGSYEVMAFSATTEGAIHGWMDTLYHRIPLIHPNAERWGYGEVFSGARVQVGDVVYSGSTSSGPAYWPPRGATDVDTSWNGAESPQPPLPPGESYPSGPVITVSFPLGAAGDLSSATLVAKATGTPIPVMVRDPSNDSWLASTWAMYAFDPLEASTTYIVTFSGSQTVSWEFTTRP